MGKEVKKKANWKYVWNSAGYGPETFEVSTAGKSVGDYFFTPHTYFKGSSVRAARINTEGQKTTLIVGKPEQKPDADIWLENPDQALSELVGSPVYRKLTIKTARALGPKIQITCEFLGDALDPALFNQALHQDADVEHKSLIACTVASELGDFKKVEAEELKGFWGEITQELATLKSETLDIGSQIMISPDKIETQSEALELRTSTGFLKFEPKTKRWHAFNARSKEEVPLVTFFKNLSPDPFYGLPVILASDPGALTFVSWLTIDPSQQKLIATNMEVEKLAIQDFIELPDNARFKIGDFTIEAKEGSLHIGGSITINKDSVKIGALRIDQEFMRTWIDLRADVEKLKEKVK